jgi:hypothetical protein
VGHRRNKSRKEKFPVANENESTIYHYVWDTKKAVLRGKFTAMSAYFKRTETSQINDIMLHLILEKKRTSKTQSKQERNKK